MPAGQEDFVDNITLKSFTRSLLNTESGIHVVSANITFFINAWKTNWATIGMYQKSVYQAS